jgi:aldehyde dehydrogenase (NAD+)
MGTAGQRCTTLRRLFVHENVYDRLVPRLSQVYAAVKVDDPRQAGTLVGPLIDRRAFESMQRALAEAREAGGFLHGGERIAEISGENAYYVRPALCEMPEHAGPVLRETFAPILYVMRYSELDDAIRMHNAVGAGLTSSIFTLDVREAERFVSATGSDCGIANVNIGLRELRLAVLLAARRRRAAVARPAPTHGRPICVAPPTRSISGRNFRSHRA